MSSVSQPTTAIRLMIVDDHELFSESVSGLLKQHQALEVRHRVGSAAEALRVLETEAGQLDIILLDVFLDKKQPKEPIGLKLAQNILQTYFRRGIQELKVILLTGGLRGDLIYQSFISGIQGFLYKGCESERLLEAIYTVQQGGLYYRDEVRRLMDEHAVQRPPGDPEPIVALTPTELEVLKNIAYGLKTDEIAQKRRCSTASIEAHRRNIMIKLRANNASHAVAIGFRMGILQ